MARRYDSFGVGFYHDEFKELTAGTAKLSDERGVEAFHDFAITSAVRLIPSYQHIWNPFSAQVVTQPMSVKCQ
jgi:porin